MACTFKTIKTDNLCYSSLKHKATIVSRSLAPNHPDDIQGQYNSIDELFSFYCATETKKGVKPSASVNTGAPVTHVFYARYRDLMSFEIDIKKHRIQVNGYTYMIDSVDNINEADVTVAIYCVETGINDDWSSRS